MAAQAGPKQLRRLLDAVVAIGGELELEALLQRVVDVATELADARYGALGVLDESGTRLAQFLTVGVGDEERARIGDLPEGHGLLGLLISEPAPLRLPDLHDHPASVGFPPNHPPMTSFLGVPIRTRGEVFGNLYLCDKAGDDVFTDVDEEMVVALATAAGVAIQNARLHAQIADLVLLAEHDRIARDLHDTVIQRLFSTGLGLQGAIRLARDPNLVDRLQRAVAEIDETVREVRSAIFEMHTARLPGRSLREEVLAVCAESGRSLGHEPVVRFDGPVDAAVDGHVADHALAVLREALSNVVRHAGASRVEVDVTVREDRLAVVVGDDGAGLPPGRPAGGRGLDNMQTRAAKLGGRATVSPGHARGTVVRWEVPIGG